MSRRARRHKRGKLPFGTPPVALTPQQEREAAERGVPGYQTYEDFIAEARLHSGAYGGEFGASWIVFDKDECRSVGCNDPIF